MPHLNLTFTNTSGTALPTHDANWVPYSGVANSDVAIRDNAARREAGNNGRFYYNVNLGTPDFAVEWDHKFPGTAGGRGGVIINANASATTDGYLFRSDVGAGEWQLYKIDAGNFTLIDSAAFSFANTTTYACRVERNSTANTIVCKVDGVTVCSATDADFKANDRIGIRLSDGLNVYLDNIVTSDLSSAPQAIRKGSTFDVETTLSGTVTVATLNGNAITVDSQTGTTVTLTDSGSGVTTSGEYDLVLTDDSADPDETITMQVNVIGLPAYTLNKDGAPLGSLTGIKARVTATGELDGTELYSANNLTATAGVLDSNIELATGDVGDTVTVSILTGANDGVSVETTLELL